MHLMIGKNLHDLDDAAKGKVKPVVVLKARIHLNWLARIINHFWPAELEVAWDVEEFKQESL